MVSVCIATFNGEKYIKAQLDSIIVQLGENDEIIISDDGSTDETLKIIKNINDSRIKVFSNALRKGVVGNFENALNKSVGDFIFLSDQDDIWLENKVKFCLADLTSGFDLVIHNSNIFDSKSKEILEESYFEFISSKKGVFKNIFKNSYVGCCMAFNKKMKGFILPFPIDIPMHDSWIGIMIELKGNVLFNNKVLLSYRKHDDNVSATSTNISKYSMLSKIGFRIRLIKNLVKRVLFGL